jgi:TetR/AcrR family transcriptional regulator, transcriptional repressor for nem operon
MSTTGSETAAQILDAAERLCQRQGFSGFSFRDLAEAVGVKSASVHYHFPTKQDLARAMILRYRQHFENVRAEIDRRESTAAGRLKRLFNELSKLYADASKICLAAVLAGEAAVLDEPVRDELKRFFADNERWLEQTIQLGVKQKSFRLVADPASTAKLVFAVIEGAIVGTRATSDPTRLAQACECVLKGLSVSHQG